MKVRFTDAARDDLKDIARFIAEDNPRRARSFTAEIYAAALAIGDTPYGFPLIPRYEDKGFRRRPFRSYLIFYDIRSTGVRILRVLHSARDYEALLKAE